MSTLVLTGPPASGKNSVAECLGKRLPRCAAIEVDTAQRMVVQPACEPWQGKEGEHQRSLGVRNACSLVRNFEAERYDTVVMDVLTNEMALQYRTELTGVDLTIVLLLPTEQEVNGRLMSRTDYLTRGETDWLYAQQSSFDGYDERIDNTTMAPEDVADWLLERWTPTYS